MKRLVLIFFAIYFLSLSRGATVHKTRDSSYFGYEKISEDLPLATCIGISGEKGECVSILECNNILLQNHSKLLSTTCSWNESTPLVCCAKDEHRIREHGDSNNDPETIVFHQFKPLSFKQRHSIQENKKRFNLKRSDESGKRIAVHKPPRTRRAYIDELLKVIARVSRKKQNATNKSFALHYFLKDIGTKNQAMKLPKGKSKFSHKNQEYKKQILWKSGKEASFNKLLNEKSNDSTPSDLKSHLKEKVRRTREARSTSNETEASMLPEVVVKDLEIPVVDITNSNNTAEAIPSIPLLVNETNATEIVTELNESQSTYKTTTTLLDEKMDSKTPNDTVIVDGISKDESLIPDEPTEMEAMVKVEQEQSVANQNVSESGDTEKSTVLPGESENSSSVNSPSLNEEHSGNGLGGNENNANNEGMSKEMSNDTISKMTAESNIIEDIVNIENNKQNSTEISSGNATLNDTDNVSSTTNIPEVNVQNSQNESFEHDNVNDKESKQSVEREIKSVQTNITNNEDVVGFIPPEQSIAANSTEEESVENKSNLPETVVNNNEVTNVTLLTPDLIQTENITEKENPSPSDDAESNMHHLVNIQSTNKSDTKDKTSKENETISASTAATDDIEKNVTISIHQTENQDQSNENTSISFSEESTIKINDTKQNEPNEINSTVSSNSNPENKILSNKSDIDLTPTESPLQKDNATDFEIEVVDISNVKNESRDEEVFPNPQKDLDESNDTKILEEIPAINKESDTGKMESAQDNNNSEVLIPVSKSLNIPVQQNDTEIDPGDGLPIPKLPDPLIKEEAVIIIPTISEEHEIKQNFEMSDRQYVMSSEEKNINLDKDPSLSVLEEENLPQRESIERSVEARNLFKIDTKEMDHRKNKMLPNPKTKDISFSSTSPFTEQSHLEKESVIPLAKSPPFKGEFIDSQTMEEFYNLHKSPENIETEEKDVSKNPADDVEVLSIDQLSELHKSPPRKDLSDMDTSLETAEIQNVPVFHEYYAASSQQQQFVPHFPPPNRRYPPYTEEGTVHFPNSGGTNVSPTRSEHPSDDWRTHIYQPVPVVDPSRYPVQTGPSYYPASAIDYNFGRPSFPTAARRIQASPELWDQSPLTSGSHQSRSVETLSSLQTRPAVPPFAEKKLPVNQLNPSRENIINSICGLRRNKKFRRDALSIPLDNVDEKEALSAGAVYGGIDTNIGNWPWMAAIMVRNPETNKLDLHCGGLIIGTRHILSAAHCFKSGWKPSDFTILLGEYDLNSETDGAVVVQYHIRDIILHPRYSPRQYHNDIAILKLTEPIIFTDTILPICLPDGNTLPEGTPVTVAGWGRTSFDGKPSGKLQEISITVLPKSVCETSYRQLPNFNISLPNGLSDFICAGVPDGSKNSCLGDSGGPLMSLDKSDRWSVKGIVSFGYKCALKDYPGLYLDVSQQVSWIKSQSV